MAERPIHPSAVEIGKRIDKLRKERQETIMELAEVIGMSYSFTRAILQGTRRANPENLIDIAKYYNVSLDYICGLTNVEPPTETVWAAYEGAKTIMEQIKPEDILAMQQGAHLLNQMQVWYQCFCSEKDKE